nr:hypothetical protein PJ912_08035 [Pectobacterium colocasium]
MKKETGSVELGKSADLIVLDRHLFNVPINRFIAPAWSRRISKASLCIQRQRNPDAAQSITRINIRGVDTAPLQTPLSPELVCLSINKWRGISDYSVAILLL